ncbi:MAG TPA: hypothetical protein VGG28_15000 [Kofleriaceae bacterium]|jgi:hypothetical protein
MRGLFVAIVLVAAGCPSKDPPPRPTQLPIDAGVRQLEQPTPVMPPTGSTIPTGHLDDDFEARHTSSGEPRRASRPIDVMLKSTPTGAQAAVDGIVIGPTPAYWSGNADGKEHEFTFVLSGHAIARYRFVPIASGTIHARLVPISDDVDAGVPPPEVVPPVVVRPPDPPAPLLAPDAGVANPYGPLP